MRKSIQILALILLIAVVLFVANKLPAQDQQNIKPYQFATFPVEMQFTDGQVYKTVHQGCELFIAVVGKDSQSPSVSITTGRGCK